MPIPVNTIVSVVAWVILLAMFPTLSASASAPDGQEGEKRWVPSLAVISGITIDGARGSVLALDSSNQPIRPPDDGYDRSTSPFVGADLELMTPALPIPGRPRLFASGEILPTFGTGHDLAKEGNPIGVQAPDIPEPPPGQLPPFGYSDEAYLGQGSRATSEVGDLSYGAGLGLLFPFEWRGRQLRVKTSLEWTSFKVSYEGRVTRGVCLPYVPPPPFVATTRCIDFQPVGSPTAIHGFARDDPYPDLSAQDSQSYHAIGPGLELELETGRAGPIGHSIFLGARAYRILGDRTVELSDTISFDDEIGLDTYRADWAFELNRWMYRAVLGLRLHWLGR